MTDTAATLETALNIAIARAPSHDTADGGRLVIIPERYKAHKIEPLEPPLTRIHQAVTFHDRDSFVSYVCRFKSETTRLFAEPGFIAGGVARVHAVLDYHAPAVPDRCVHVATYLPRYSDQWTRWHAVCKEPLAQVAFAELIEECRTEIAKPEAANLLDIVRTFKASRKVEFDSLSYQPNGDVVLAYSDKTQQGAASGAMPEQMTLGIPVYFRGTVYAVPLFVRYRVSGGAVKFQLKMDRSDLIEDAAFGELTKDIAEKTGIEVYLGRRA